MLKLTNKQQTINAVSVISVDDGDSIGDVPVMYMSATIREDGNTTFGQTIVNNQLYAKHSDEIQRNYTEFYEYIMLLTNSKNKEIKEEE